ncbi:transcriptional regulator, TetR family [Pseudoxanthobacter soli DSM 19599]|uniref:Transcriptional regulator, TetR family n=1 Tax=Pseudoxanthobacter soli DSM 19599 TaxID=1123029 RepID=A0A1M7ZQ15_9HYPH|nr:transcriptional regulator, TetR family [Pseudoxanthobacter soli DSM 19599]
MRHADQTESTPAAPPVRRSPKRRVPARERMEQIVEAVIDVLAAHGANGAGLESLTIADVARAAGVSPALVMLHFKSKDGLLEETLRTLGNDYFRALGDAREGAGPRAADRLWALVEAEFSEPVCTPRKLAAWRALWTASAGRQPYIRQFKAETVAAYATLIELCRAIIEEGAYEDRDARTVARLIDSSLAGLWIDLTDLTLPLTLNEARRIALAQLAMFFPRHYTTRGPRRQILQTGADA